MGRAISRSFAATIIVLVCTAPAGPLDADETPERPESPIPFGAVEDVDDVFEDSFPGGKTSVVRRELSTSDALLRRAHRAALQKGKERADYRRALVYQVASRRALGEDRFALAMYLTMHARSLGREAIHANTSVRAVAIGGANPELIQRAGGVGADDVEAFLRRADRHVLSVERLFFDDER